MSELAYELNGPPGAPVLVLSSSVGVTREMWAPQVAELSGTWRVLSYDHPGHGGSPDPAAASIPAFAAQLHALLGDLGVDRFSLWGLSMGGMVAMSLAASHPGQVERLALSATTLAFPSPEPWHDRARAVRAEGLGAVADMVMGRFFSDSFRESQADTVRRFRDALLSCSPEGYARCCEALAAWRFTRGAEISCPTLVLAGGQDSATPAELSQAVADAIPGARLETIAGAGHLLTVEKPAEATTRVRAFLES